MYYTINSADLRPAQIYIATLEKDCTPKIYLNLGNALDYLWRNLPKDMQTPEQWSSLKTYNEEEECWIIKNFGWVQAFTPCDMA